MDIIPLLALSGRGGCGGMACNEDGSQIAIVFHRGASCHGIHDERQRRVHG